jgi:hypothetical protein
MRAYVTHIAIAKLDPTPQEKDRLDQVFDQQISNATGGLMIVLLQSIAIYYVRKLRRESSQEA